MTPFRMLSTSGILGYGFPEESFARGLAREPQMIGVDGGSVDPGPHYLGSGAPLSSRRAMKRDLTLMLTAARGRRIPLVIGTAGGAGGEPHLALTVDLVREIAGEYGLHFRLAMIHAEQDASALRTAYEEGRITPLRNAPPINVDTFGRAARTVAMMGPEPFIAALEGGADVILAGRSSDPAPWAGCAMHAGVPPAQAWFAGKMLECGAAAATPVSASDCIIVEADSQGVTIEPTNAARRCTPNSVATFSLHENTSPIVHTEPGGTLFTDNNLYTAVSDRSVRVTGMRWENAAEYTVKLEAAEPVGFRALNFCATRDPGLLRVLDSYLAGVHERVTAAALAMGLSAERFELIVRCYGRNGVMGEREPLRHRPLAHEIAFLVEVIAPSQEDANAVCALARTYMLHGDFEGRLCNEGNMAMPISPADIAAGLVFRFSLHHTLAVHDPLAPFPIEWEEV